MEKEKINILVFSESLNFTSLTIKKLTEDNEEINLVGFINRFDAFVKTPLLNKNIIVILYVTAIISENIEKAISFLDEKGIYFMTICEDANIGFEMMKKGALAIVLWKNASSLRETESNFRTMTLKIKDAFKIKALMNKREVKREISIASKKIIAIGSSTGGTEAVLEILKRLPQEVPPILIVQHMPPVFTRMYAERLNDICKMTVWEARNGDKLKPGLVLLAPGDFQMKLIKKSDGFYVQCAKGEKVNGHAPSVDVLFNSVASLAGRNAVGVILTGMGKDGAEGLLNMKKNGAYTIGQNQESCIVYGMPKAAFDIGAVDRQVTLTQIAAHIMENI